MRFLSKIFNGFSESLNGPAGNGVSAVIAILSGCVFILYLDSHHDDHRNIEIAGTIVLGILIYISIDTLIRSVSHRKVEKILSQIEAQSYYNGTVSRRLLELSDKDPLFQVICKQRFSGYLADFVVPKRQDAIEFKSPVSVIGSFSDFWDEVIKYQEQKVPGKTINIFVTHAGAIDLYSNISSSLTHELLSKQNKFLKNKGNIFRVFVREDLPTSDLSMDEYKATMSEMRGKGAKIAYLDPSENRTNPLFGINYDLLIMNPGNYVVFWNRQRDGTLLSCRFSREKKDYDRAYAAWSRVVELLEEKEKTASSRKDDTVLREKAEIAQAKDDFFHEYRKEFLEAYKKITD